MCTNFNGHFQGPFEGFYFSRLNFPAENRFIRSFCFSATGKTLPNAPKYSDGYSDALTPTDAFNNEGTSPLTKGLDHRFGTHPPCAWVRDTLEPQHTSIITLHGRQALVWWLDLQGGGDQRDEGGFTDWPAETISCMLSFAIRISISGSPCFSFACSPN